MTEAPSRRLSRQDWIEGTIGFLAVNNVDALRLDVLCDQMRVTKGSFYWHFKSREALLDAVLETWRQRMTSDIEAWMQSNVGTPAGRLRRLLRIAVSARPDVPGGPLELTLRDWARRDPRVDAVLRKVDSDRLGIFRALYEAAGLEPDDAEAYALLHITYVAGGRSMLFDGDAEALEKRRRIGERRLIEDALA